MVESAVEVKMFDYTQKSNGISSTDQHIEQYKINMANNGGVNITFKEVLFDTKFLRLFRGRFLNIK